MFFQLFLKNLDNYLKAPTSQTEDTLLAGFLQQIGLKIITTFLGALYISFDFLFISDLQEVQ